MRYENPLYMAEAAATADLIANGRLQLGVSRGSPEAPLDGPGSFGYPLPDGVSPAEDAAERIARFREAWRAAGHEGEPRVSVSRSIMPIIDDATARYFGPLLERDKMGGNRDHVGELENTLSTFGKTYVGELDKIEVELRDDDAVMTADTVLVTVPNQLGADFNRITFDALVELRNRLRND